MALEDLKSSRAFLLSLRLFLHQEVEGDFYQALQDLQQTSKKKDYLKKAGKLKEYIFFQSNPYSIYRLSLELDGKNQSISDLEDHFISCIIHSYHLNLLLTWACNIKQANINKLQAAIISTGSSKHIAEFACFVSKADFEVLQEIIWELKKPVGADILIRYAPKKTNIELFRPLLLKSKKPKYLLLLARYTKEERSLKEIWSLLLKGNSLSITCQFWAMYPEIASLNELEQKVLQTKDHLTIKKAYELTKSTRLARYVLMM